METQVRERDAAGSPFAAPGEMAARCRDLDWAATSLGAPGTWSPALRTIVRTCLESPFPVNLWCGPELVLVYNDAYRRVLGAKHPEALGRPGLEVWADIRADVEPMFAQIRAGGPPIYAEDARFVMVRAGDAEGTEAYFTFGLSAVRDDAGEIVAFFNPATETTARILADRRLAAANRALEVERARLATVFERSPSFLAVLRGAQHRFELANDAYLALVGRRPVVGRLLTEALPEVAAQGFVALLDRVYATGEPFVGREVAVRLARGDDAPASADASLEERFVDFVYLPLVDADGARTGVIVHGTDVTGQVRARQEVERLLEETREAHRAVAQANEQLEEQQVELELTNQQLQDNTIELEAQADELQATTAALEAERGRLARIVERLPVGVKVVAGDGTVVTRNHALERIYGHAVKESVVMDVDAAYGAIHADGRRYAREEYPIVRAVLRGETVLREITRYRRGDGSIVTLSISAAPVRDERGEVEGAVAAVEDVTDLESARAAAEEANRAKSQFLANMSHELRTPLNAIQGHLQLLEMELHGPLEPRQRETIGRIDRAQRHLLGLINDILGYARLESGRVEYDVQPTLVADVVRDVLPIVEPLAHARRITFAARMPEQLGHAPVPVWADREKLAQVLLNLLSNAVKFTAPGGTVTVEVETQPEDGASDGGGVAHVHVRDTGVGIPADKLEAIFEPFVQVRNAYTPGQGGTGLGLTISRDLARGMGGDLRVTSAEGTGSTFTVALRRVASPAGATLDRRSGEERRVEEERRSGEERREAGGA